MREIADFVVAPDILPNDWTLQRIRDYATSIFSSWGRQIVEENFKKMRDREVSDTRNKSHLPLVYWAMARDMNAIGKHNREEVTTQEADATGDHRKPLPKNLFSTVGHNVKLPDAQDIMTTAKWPTYSPQSAQFQYSAAEFLSSIDAKSTPEDDGAVWTVSSRVWRGVLFHTGMVIRKTGTDDYYVCIGFIGKLLVLLWKVLPMKLARGRFLAFAVGTGININTHPVWVSAMELDDYDALPTTVISPLHL